MTGRLDLWTGRQVAPGHRVYLSPSADRFGRRKWRGRCSCGWAVGPYSDDRVVIGAFDRHGRLARELAAGGPIGG